MAVEDVVLRGWEAMAADGAMFSFCARGPTEDGWGEDESGGEGKREAPPLDKAGFCAGASSVSALVAVASQERLVGVALDTDGLYLGGEVGDRAASWAAGVSLGRLLDSERYEDSRERSCCKPDAIMPWNRVWSAAKSPIMAAMSSPSRADGDSRC